MNPTQLQQLLQETDGQYGAIILPDGVMRRLLIPAATPGPSIGPSPMSLPTPGGGLGLRMEPIDETLEDNWYQTGTATTYGIAGMLDAPNADKVVLYIVSTLTQAVTIQTVGSYVDQPGNLANLIAIGSTFSQGAGSTAQSINSIEIILDQIWHPFLGITVTTGAAAITAGKLVVIARGQRWVS